ncbi:hypothetical protein [Pseudonocardia sp. GCM10023141]|uniref:hypothetical protein n=1 Tax=Pseudonocardia sp. GCM10023141 TaxID=3252653 RepID=UPI0036185928
MWVVMLFGSFQFNPGRVQPITPMTNDVARNGDDRDRPEFVAVNDRDAVEVEVAPPHSERLADPHAGAEHEGHEVREVAPPR